MPLASGTRLGPYEILAPLGAGGMGEVYHARDPRLNRDVALKILSAGTVADAEIRRRFEQEARATASSAKPPLPGCRGSCRSPCGSGSRRIDSLKIDSLKIESLKIDSLTIESLTIDSLRIAGCGCASANRQ